MALAEFQKTILSIYTNEKTRRVFLQNPDQFLAPLNLTDREKNALKKIPHRPLNIFSHSLSGKRYGLIKKMVSDRPNLVVNSSFYVSGPVIFFKNGNDEKMIEVSDSETSFFKKISDKIEVKNIVSKVSFSNPQEIQNAIKFMFFINRHNLWGKRVLNMASDE